MDMQTAKLMKKSNAMLTNLLDLASMTAVPQFVFQLSPGKQDEITIYQFIERNM